MVSRSYIRRNLKSLNQKYLRSKTQAEPYFYSKLAVIELCGWIEMSIDEIVERCAPKLVAERKYLNKVTGKKEHTFGFHENKHLKPLINTLIGYNGIEKFESSCNQSILGSLYRNLNDLSKMRNEIAHTYIKGFTNRVDSPQVLLNRFDQVADGLDHLEEKIIELSEKLREIN